MLRALNLVGARAISGRRAHLSHSGTEPFWHATHSNTDKMKKRCTVADSVANIGESGDRDRCLGTSVAYLGVNTRP